MTFTATLKSFAFASALDAILLTAAAHAQDQKAPEPAPQPASEAPAKPAPKPEAAPPKQNAGTPAMVLDLQEVDGVIGKSMRSATGEDMGRIIDVIVAGDGKVRAAIIDFGGFLGVGSRKVAVDWHALNFGRDGKAGSITSALTRDQVRISPEIKSGEPIVVLGLSQKPAEEKSEKEKTDKNASGVNGKTPENIPAPQAPASQQAPAPQPANPSAPKTEPTEAPQQKP